jgi:hypothetical protein
MCLQRTRWCAALVVLSSDVRRAPNDTMSQPPPRPPGTPGGHHGPHGGLPPIRGWGRASPVPPQFRPASPYCPSPPPIRLPPSPGFHPAYGNIPGSPAPMFGCPSPRPYIPCPRPRWPVSASPVPMNMGPRPYRMPPQQVGIYNDMMYYIRRPNHFRSYIIHPTEARKTNQIDFVFLFVSWRDVFL